MPSVTTPETARNQQRQVGTVTVVLAPVRFVIILIVLGMLVRSAWGAWHNRRVAVAVWRRIRPRHVFGSLALVVVVVAVAVMLATLMPVTQFGVGSLVGVSGNAVFAPVQNILLDSGETEAVNGHNPSMAPRAKWLGLALVAGFCGLLLVLFPWLAYLEECVFREGLEYANLRQQTSAALRFGLAHLAMLIPVAAALAISVAGFCYGLIYRAAYHRAANGTLIVAPGLARAEAVLASTVWHTTFNTLLVVLLLAGLARTLGQG
jgi:hypothetical protein